MRDRTTELTPLIDKNTDENIDEHLDKTPYLNYLRPEILLYIASYLNKKDGDSLQQVNKKMHRELDDLELKIAEGKTTYESIIKPMREFHLNKKKLSQAEENLAYYTHKEECFRKYCCYFLGVSPFCGTPVVVAMPKTVGVAATIGISLSSSITICGVTAFTFYKTYDYIENKIKTTKKDVRKLKRLTENESPRSLQMKKR